MIAQTAHRLRAQIEDFSGNLTRGLSKPLRRFVGEALQGIVGRQSVLLSEIARSLNEPIALIKTENRLSRNLGAERVRPVLQGSLLAAGAARVKQDSLLILDLSDVVKPYAQKMEYLARVRDGSTGEIADGYALTQVIAVENQGREITPLYGDLYSSVAADHISENEEILRAIGHVSRACPERGIWVIDRGADRGELYNELVPPERKKRFIIRMRKDRHLRSGALKASVLELARDTALPYQHLIVREEKGEERSLTLRYGVRSVRLPQHPKVPLWLVVVEGFGQDPLMILTNVPTRRDEKSVWWIVAAYLSRWRVEEAIRFIKQSYELEDVRVRTYERLRNMTALVMAAMYFTAVVLGTRIKLHILVTRTITAAKRFFGTPDFRYYAIADGIREIFQRCPRPGPSAPKSPSAQLCLVLP
jgi:hypothetical protein